jgi:hypothetical protein
MQKIKKRITLKPLKKIIEGRHGWQKVYSSKKEISQLNSFISQKILEEIIIWSSVADP